MPAFATDAPADRLTIAAIGVIAYILGNILHEGVGHAGACVITHGKPLLVSAVAMDCSVDNRLVTAAGTLMNAFAGAVCWVLGRNVGAGWPRLKYFLWLSMAVNLLTASGYFLFSGIGGFGDWAMFIQGLGPAWAWRSGLAIFGAVTYWLTVRLVLRELAPFLGGQGAQRRKRAARLLMTPYFAGGIVECVAGLFNPQGMFLVAMSAAASTFGGTSGLLWGMYWLARELTAREPSSEALAIRKSWPWIAAAAAAAIAFIAVLGPGVRFGAGPAR